MADKLAIMAELNRRGKLPPDKAALFAEAVKRGLIQGSGANPPAQPASPPPVPAPPSPSPNLMDATLATINGITGSIPGLQQGSDALIAGGQTGMDALTGQPMDFGARYNAIQDRRKAIVDKAPLSNIAGALGATVAGTGAIGATKAGAEALGMSGNWLRQLINSSASTAGYEGLQGLAHGHTGGRLLQDEGIGGLTGLGGSIVGQGLNKGGEVISNAVTQSAQNKLTGAAIKNAPSASELADAGSRLFESSTGISTAPMIAPAALDRLGTNIEASLVKVRPNAANDPQGVGLLQHVSDIIAAAKTPGTVVDLKDLHLTRQLAGKVAKSQNGRDALIGTTVIRNIDNFVKDLKTGDILGGKDPRQTAGDLLKGISTWHKAEKVSLIEDAIAHADTYKSGVENGLKLSFLNLMKSPDFLRLSKIEQDAVRQVAKGTTGQNIAEGLGKLGFSLGGSAAHNILGAGVGTAGLTAGLTPFLGPLAFPAALATTTAVGAGGRAMAEKIAKGGADRAARVLATPNIPIAAQRPNLLAPGSPLLQLLIRGGAATANN